VAVRVARWTDATQVAADYMAVKDGRIVAITGIG
jgi:hypothetical protein